MARRNETQPGNPSENEEVLKLDASRLSNGVRDFLLRNVRENGMKKPWQKMTEGEQRLEIERATDKADELIDAIVDIVSSGDFPVVHAQIDNYKSKDGTVTITAKGVADDDVILNLHHAGKKPVKIVIADRNQFDKTRTNLEPDPDQPGLPGVKQELQPEDLTGGFEPDPEDETDEAPAFDDDAEQAEGEQALTPKSDQWRGGFNSRMAAHRREENPFNPNSGPDWEDWKKDWFAGWDAADFDDKAPPLKGKPTAELVKEAEEIDRGDGGDDSAPEEAETVEEPAPEGGAEIPPHDPETGEAEPSADDLAKAKADGIAARKDGQSPKKNPHDKESPLHQAWTDGYLEQKAAEQKSDNKPKDAAFDD